MLCLLKLNSIYASVLSWLRFTDVCSLGRLETGLYNFIALG